MVDPKITLGVVLGNRDFFPDSLIAAGRAELLAVLAELGIEAILLDPAQTVAGSVETWEDAKKCAALFDAHRKEIRGILISLPNFGDEKAAVDAIKLSGLRVPILVHAFPDDLNALSPERRDAFCGKISVCNNLYQYGYPYSVTRRHTLRPGAAEFKRELGQFSAVCRGQRPAERAHRRRGCPSECIQHHPLQRKTAAGRRDQRPDRGPLRDPWGGGQAGGR